MKVNEKVIVEKLVSGLYKITYPDGIAVVGNAASTTLSLAHAVFLEEASDVPVSYGLKSEKR